MTVSCRRSASGVGGATGVVSPCAGETSGVAGSGTGEAVVGALDVPPVQNEHSAVFIHGQTFGVDEFILEGLQVLVIQRELAFQRPIGEALLALQQCDHLRTEGREVHHCPSTCARAASVWGSQKVISMSRYSAMAVDNSVWACSCWPTLAYSVPRPRWQWAWSGRMPSASARASAWR